ncbi:hypothetical protein [Neptunicella sp.]|uniref:hypothetical protein n=1 Tax=Neptunicella sp. TaxID=2125986 RepID=UPI003F68EF2E
MHDADVNTVDAVKSQQNEASITDVLPSFEQLLNAWQQRWQAGKSLVEADIRLSLKAIAICAMAALMMVAVTTVLWLAANTTLAVGLSNWNVHWAIIASIILVLNSLLLYWLMQLFRGAFNAISLRTSISTLMANNQPASESQSEEGA